MTALRVNAPVAQATVLLTRYAHLGTELALADTARNDAIAAANSAADTVTAPIVAEMDQIRATIEPWWARNGASLLTGKRKTVELGGCIIGSKAGRASLQFAGGDDAAATAALQGARWAKIEHPTSQSFFLPLAGGAQQSGPRPRMVLADEIHEFSVDTQIEIWRAAIAKVAGSAMMFMGSNCPATAQLVGSSYANSAIAIAKGDVKDDTQFAFVARSDKRDHDTIFEDESSWHKSLPALGVTYPVANIREQVATAQTRLSTAASVKRLYFGIPTGSADFWIREDKWAAVLQPIDDEIRAALKGCRCYLSLDLSKKNDLTALTATWVDGDNVLWSKTWYWTTEEGLPERQIADQAPYDEWIEAKYLTAVPGPTIDKTFVAQRVADLVASDNVVELVFDPAQMADFEEACHDIGLPIWRYEGPDKPAGTGLKLVKHAQGTKVVFEDKQHCMPRSIERFEDRILEGTIVIDNSPVTYSCASNAAITPDGQGNRMFDKKKSRGRIDGIVTTAMGVGAADGAELAAEAYEGTFVVDLDSDEDEA